MKKIFLLFISLAVVFGLAGCERKQQHVKPQGHARVEVYRSQSDGNSSGDWVYWYILYSTVGNNTSVYYYSSPIPIANYNNAQFTRAENNVLPKEVQSELNSAEQLPEQNLQPEEIPEQIEQEWEQLELDLDNPNETTEAVDTSASEAESSSMESSADAGGGDFGGGDSGGGGGGGE